MKSNKKRILSLFTVFILAVCLFSTASVLVPKSPASVTAYAATTKGTGLYKSGGVWKYYQNGKFTKATGLVKKAKGSDKNWYYVKKGKRKNITTIAKQVNGGSTQYYVKNGKLNTKTGTVKVKGKTYHLKKGKVIPVAKNVKSKLKNVGQLKKMLTYFAFNNRSYSQASNGYTNEFTPAKSNGLLQSLFAVTPGYSCANWTLYPVKQPERYYSYDGSGRVAYDPRYLMDNNFVKYYEDAANWIGTNIFNLSQTDINKFRAAHSADDRILYYDSGVYYHMTGGVGGPFPNTVKIKEAWKAGGYYYIKYSMDFGSMNQYYNTSPSYNYATLKLKTINGKKYWSLYAHSLKKFKTPQGKKADFIKP